MNIKVGNSVEPLTTIITSKNPGICMEDLMALELVLGLVVLLADQALVGDGRAVVLVVCHLQLAFEFFSTIVTLEWLLTVTSVIVSL